MGLFDFMFEDDDTPQKNKKPKKKLSDILFVDEEQSHKPKRSFFDLLFEEEKPEVEFTDPEEIHNMANTINGKLQDKKRELTMMGLALRQIDIKDFPGSEEIIQQYLELVETQQRLLQAEEHLQEDDIMGRITLETDYEEFEQKYNSRIPRIKTLFYYKELKNQNSRMKSTFNNKRPKEITDEVINDFKEYTQKIIEQQPEFSDDYKDEILGELLTAEYRLGMLSLVRDIYFGEEPLQNPFSKYSRDKKSKFAELLLEDINEAIEQYQRIMERQNLYIKTKVFEQSSFEKLSQEAEELDTEINNGIIGDLSVSSFLENDQYDTLTLFLRFKMKMNKIDFKYEQAKDIDLQQYLKSKNYRKTKKGKKPEYDGEDRKIKPEVKKR